LGVSLGATKFCLSALIDKGHLKLANLKVSKRKMSFVYVLTTEGIAHRGRLSTGSIERKITKYDALQAELERLSKVSPMAPNGCSSE
jgi:hypothetical protein